VTLAESRVQRELDGQFPSALGDSIADDPPAIHAVDEIFAAAIGAGASDIHIEPFGEGGRVRERVDGMLCEARFISRRLLPRILSRIKLLAGMDIADRRLPQDGRYAIDRPNGSIDARVSSMPTIGGEKLAIRLLDSRQHIPSLESLGMSPELLPRYRRVIAASSGFVIVCGPTGSGKTTTLYASMCERDNGAEQLCSIEDPVEIRLSGIAQVQVNVRAGLTFAAGLRSFLRQDPNVIMIGEMRDSETACVATSAALCGQLVLTTLHSKDVFTAIGRLIELGISPKSVAAAVSAVVSQRLLRRLCTECKRQTKAGVWAAVGCRACGSTGYRGRCAAFEFAHITPELGHAIETEAGPAVVHEAAKISGYKPLAEGVADLIATGESSPAEAERILGVGETA